MRNNYQINFNKIVTTVGLFVIETKTYHTNCKYFRYYFSLSRHQVELHQDRRCRKYCDQVLISCFL